VGAKASPQYTLTNSLLRKGAWTKQETTIISTITSGLADGLLITSIALSLSGIILKQTNNITAYHYDLICYLGLAATYTSVITIFATPVLDKKNFLETLRILGYYLSIGLLGGVLCPITRPFQAGHTFPARAPTPGTGKQSALVLQASCFIDEPVTSNCTYNTDHSLIPALTDGYTLIFLTLITVWGTGINNYWRQWWSEYGEDDEKENAKIPESGLALLRLLFEVSAIGLSTAVSAISFLQFYKLRAYMNESGWLSDEAEIVVDSFSQLLPILQGLFILIILAASLDGKHI
jgi:hypothetical protein